MSDWLWERIYDALEWATRNDKMPDEYRTNAIMSLSESTKTIQHLVGVAADGAYGPETANAILKEFVRVGIANPDLILIHHVKASSFADPADVAAFQRCKAQGNSDQACFKVGDNGIGKWGDDTTVNVPMCALPPDDWRQLGSNARGAKVLVTGNGRTVICELRDTMPAKANVKNGAGIDLNPAAVEALGLHPPIMIPATWRWV